MQIGGKTFKVIAGILLSLIGLTLAGGGAVLIYRQAAGGGTVPAAVRSNVIRKEDAAAETVQAPDSSAPTSGPPAQGGAQSEAVSAGTDGGRVEIALHKRHAQDNQRFQVSGMMPGDQISREYEIEIHHQGKGILSLQAKADDESGALSEVLRLRVTGAEAGRVLYDGLMRELDAARLEEELPSQAAGVTRRRYRFEVYLPEETGNLYQMNRLTAAWVWRAQGTGGGDLLPVPTGDFRFPATLAFAGLGILCLAAVLFMPPRLKHKFRIGKGKSEPWRERDAG